MSDTVKLIIEIPKDYYEVIAKSEIILTSPRSGKTFMSVIYSAVKNGTPLDDIKAKIQAEEMVETDIAREFYNMALADAIQILANIGKAESEEDHTDDL